MSRLVQYGRYSYWIHCIFNLHRKTKNHHLFSYGRIGAYSFGTGRTVSEIESEDEFLDLIRDELNDKVRGHFDDDSIEIRMIIKTGKPTDQIIEVVNSIEPDLLLMGKKVGYAGEGIIPKEFSNMWLIPFFLCRRTAAIA